MQPAGSFTGCLRATGLNKMPGELGAASSTQRRPYGFLKLSQRPRNRKGAGRKWPKYPFLLAKDGQDGRHSSLKMNLVPYTGY